MKKDKILLILLLSIFFLLDLIRPFGYALSSEFLFLGIVMVSLNYDLGVSLFFAIIFGYFKDSLTPQANPFSMISFTFLCILIHILGDNLLLAVRISFRRYLKVAIGAIAIIIYDVFNFICMRLAFPVLFIQFFIQSLLLLLLMDYLLAKWKKKTLPQNFSSL
jgi:cell shape-determining protein MreD